MNEDLLVGDLAGEEVDCWACNGFQLVWLTRRNAIGGVAKWLFIGYQQGIWRWISLLVRKGRVRCDSWIWEPCVNVGGPC